MARDLLSNPDNSIAELLGLSPGSFYNHVPDRRRLRASGRAPRLLEAAG